MVQPHAALLNENASALVIATAPHHLQHAAALLQTLPHVHAAAILDRTGVSDEDAPCAVVGAAHIDAATFPRCPGGFYNHCTSGRAPRVFDRQELCVRHLQSARLRGLHFRRQKERRHDSHALDAGTS